MTLRARTDFRNSRPRRPSWPAASGASHSNGRSAHISLFQRPPPASPHSFLLPHDGSWVPAPGTRQKRRKDGNRGIITDCQVVRRVKRLFYLVKELSCYRMVVQKIVVRSSPGGSFWWRHRFDWRRQLPFSACNITILKATKVGWNRGSLAGTREHCLMSKKQIIDYLNERYEKICLNS